MHFPAKIDQKLPLTTIHLQPGSPNEPGEQVEPMKQKLPGFYYLRVGFMVSVITGHANLVVTWAANLERQIGQGPNIWDFFYFNVQSIAVPTFVLISCLLFCIKPVTPARTVARLQKLAYLYIFWVGTWVYYTKPAIDLSILGLLTFFLRGGGWLFYFIAVLIVMTMQTSLIAVISRKWQAVVFGICALMLLITEWYVTTDCRWTKSSFYWLPSCFVLIPCFAVWLSRHLPQFVNDPKARWRWILLLLAASMIAGLIEWRFAAPREMLDEGRKWIPKHARFSIQFASLATVILGLGIRRQPGAVIRFLARNSLGIYCLHGFVIGGFVKAAQFVFRDRFQPLAIPAACLGCIVACSLVAEFLRHAFRQRLV